MSMEMWRLVQKRYVVPKGHGVDVGTMLDVFGRPDMTRDELEHSVSETANVGDLTFRSRPDMPKRANTRGHSRRSQGRVISTDGFCRGRR